MNDEERRSRIELSEKLLQVAQHLSEAEMRQSISRMYYATYQAVAVLLGKEFSHKEIPSKLFELDEKLSVDYRTLKDFRSKADYMHDWVERDFETIEDFRTQFREIIQLGLSVYQRIREQSQRSGDERS